MVYITYKDNGDSDIHEVTSYFYNEEDAKEYAKLMGQYFMAVPNISREYWPEKVKYVYCTAWPHHNEIKIDVREYEILSNEINGIKTELFTNYIQINKCFFSTKEEAEKEFNEILNEYKQIYRPNQYGTIQSQIVRKDLEGLIPKTIAEIECWGTQDDWDKYETQKAAESTPRSSGPVFSGDYATVGTAYPTRPDFTSFYNNWQARANTSFTLNTMPTILTEGTISEQR